MATKHVDSFDEHEVVDAGCVRAVLGELVLTFLFVFTAVADIDRTGPPRESLPQRDRVLPISMPAAK
jgi:aquaporin TIP